MRPIFPLIALLLLATPALAADDSRQLVNMPDLPRALMRADMLDHTAAISEIVNYLAQGKYTTAAETAEKRIGRATMGKHAGAARGQGPGRFMPDTMRQMGFNMHDAADEFAKVARGGDPAKSLTALHQLTSSCVACHMAYRTR
jgi:hypothetical protein